MGTRGTCGYFLNGEEKVTYNHFDSYPEELGVHVLGVIRDTDMGELRQKVEAIRLVSKGSKPTPDEIKKCQDANLVDTGVSRQNLEDWYCLLRAAQGDLMAYCEVGLMIDGKSFLGDSVFCEWAYIINFDTNMLEVYKGFNQDKNAGGRYAKIPPEKITDTYWGVGLIDEISFDEAKNMSDEEFLDRVKDKSSDEDE